LFKESELNRVSNMYLWLINSHK